MKVTNAGYKDPNNLKFENITVLGVPNPPLYVNVTLIGTGSRGSSDRLLPIANIQYDGVKKVNSHTLGDIAMHKCKVKTLTINSFFPLFKTEKSCGGGNVYIVVTSGLFDSNMTFYYYITTLFS